MKRLMLLLALIASTIAFPGRAAYESVIVTQASDGAVLLTLSGAMYPCTYGFLGLPTVSTNGGNYDITSSLVALGCPAVPGASPSPYSITANIGIVPDGNHFFSWHFSGAASGGVSGSFTMSGGKLTTAPGEPAPSTLEVQDMWWSGPTENGWGLSIAQNADDLFVGLYIYRDDGTPEWLVLPLGSWDAQKRSFTGMLYEPKGSWFGQYDASRFDAGNAVGQATLTFSSDSAAALDYTIRGKSGRKSIVRLPFGSTATPPVQGERAGLWWAGSARTGWGLAIGHQGNTLFSVWYTYAKDGTPTWYVMPGGAWSATDTYTGLLYRTSGKSWVSGAYDPAALKVLPVGTMTLQFTGPATANMIYNVDGTPGSESISVQPF